MSKTAHTGLVTDVFTNLAKREIQPVGWFMDATAILQRTSTGLETIKTKSVRLTQSERLILIMVNGVTPYAALREKVWALSAERFARALNTLLAKDLVFEVLLPDEARQPDVLDPSLVDKFLQQDALDPVTIISVDPEDHFGIDLIAQMGHVHPPQTSEPIEKPQALAAATNAHHTDSIPPPPRTPETSKAKSVPASAPRVNTDLASNATGASPSPEKSLPPKIQKTSADEPVRGAGQPVLPRNPASAPSSPGRGDTIRASSSKSGSGTNAHHLSYASGVRKSRKRPVDVLKLCSWTGLLSGFGIFMFLLLQYARTVA